MNKERLQPAVVRKGWQLNHLEEGPDTACSFQKANKQKTENVDEEKVSGDKAAEEEVDIVE